MSHVEYRVDQGSVDWHMARAGAITASKIKTVRDKVGCLTEQQKRYVNALRAGVPAAEALLQAGYKTKPSFSAFDRAMAGLPVGDYSDKAKDYAFRLAIERITGTPLDDDEFNPWQAERGVRLEPEARARHEAEAGVLVRQVGFITTEDGKFGASADGLIGNDEGAEYKCFLAPAKLRAILLDGDWSDLHDQCQFGMAITGRKRWHMGLYCPALSVIGRDFTLRVIERDDAYIDAMWADLLEFDARVEKYRALLEAGQTELVGALRASLETA